MRTTPRPRPSSAAMSSSATSSTRSCWACRCRTSVARRSPTSRSSRCGTSRRPSTATRSTARRRCWTSGRARCKDDRGVVRVETRGYNQDGTLVCTFRRAVLVPKQSYLDARGGDQPGPPGPRPPLTARRTTGARTVRRGLTRRHEREDRRAVSAAPSCPRCRGSLVAPGLMHSAWTCAEHGAVAPLHPARPGTSEHLAHLAARSAVPVWLPWPLPTGWLVTGPPARGRRPHRAGGLRRGVLRPQPAARCRSADRGLDHQPAADLLLVAEQPAVGLGAQPGRAGRRRRRRLAVRRPCWPGGPQAKVHAAGHPAPLWHVPSAEDRAVVRRRGPRRLAVAGDVAGQRRAPRASRGCACSTPATPGIRWTYPQARRAPGWPDRRRPRLAGVRIDLHAHSSASDGTDAPG